MSGYHVYREVWVLAFDEEFDCRQEADNKEDRYAVAIYGDTQSTTFMYSAWTPLSNFACILHVHGAQRYDHRQRKRKFVMISVLLNKTFSPDEL